MRLKSLGLLSILMLSIVGGVQAFSPSYPQSYKKVTKDGKSVFVMLAHQYLTPESKKINERYPRSGLYPNDGSKTPLWTVGRYIFDIQMSSDGVYFFEFGWEQKLGDKGESVAVEFYEKDKSLCRYLIKDLVPRPEAMPIIPYGNADGYSWVKSSVFDDVNNRLTVETIEGEDCPIRKYIFDITTGEIIKDDKTATKKE